MPTETVSNPGSAAPASAPSGQAAPAPAGTPEPQGQAAPEGQAPQGSPQGQSATTEESFTGIDPQTLPPELQNIYKSMQTDYVRKTQATAEKEKQLADVSKKAQAYDQLTSDQRFVEYWKDLSRGERADFKEQKAEAEKSLGAKISDEEFMKAFNSKDEFLSLLERVVEDKRAKDQKKIDQLEQKVGINEAADAIELVASEIDKKTNQPVRPDFYALDEDQLITGFLTVNPVENPGEYTQRVAEAYNWAKAVTSKYFEKGKAEALKVIQIKAQNSSEPPTITSKDVYSGIDPKRLDVAEAVALARKGIRVPQN